LAYILIQELQGHKNKKSHPKKYHAKAATVTNWFSLLAVLMQVTASTDSPKRNSKVVVEQKEEIKLAFYTIKNIKKSQELRFDYNNKSAH
jgi:SET domain-containing protein